MYHKFYGCQGYGRGQEDGEITVGAKPIIAWCRRSESNRHGPQGPEDFESSASTSFTTPARFVNNIKENRQIVNSNLVTIYNGQQPIILDTHFETDYIQYTFPTISIGYLGDDDH